MTLPPALERMREVGESTTRVLEVGPATLAVTDRRLLALTPAAEGPNFRAVDRPNVEAVCRDTRGDPKHLSRGVRPTILALVLVGASQFLDLEGITGATVPDGTEEGGLGGLFALIEVLFGVLAVLDTLLLAGGLLCGVLALLSLAAYRNSRTTALRVQVAGEPDLCVPLAPPADDAATGTPDPATVLERALGSSGVGAKEPTPPGEPGPRS